MFRALTDERTSSKTHNTVWHFIHLFKHLFLSLNTKSEAEKHQWFNIYYLHMILWYTLAANSKCTDAWVEKVGQDIPSMSKSSHMSGWLFHWTPEAVSQSVVSTYQSPWHGIRKHYYIYSTAVTKVCHLLSSLLFSMQNNVLVPLIDWTALQKRAYCIKWY